MKHTNELKIQQNDSFNLEFLAEPRILGVTFWLNVFVFHPPTFLAKNPNPLIENQRFNRQGTKRGKRNFHRKLIFDPQAS